MYESLRVKQRGLTSCFLLFVCFGFFLTVPINLPFAELNIGLQKFSATIFGKFNIQVTFWNFQ